jgi:DNA helicase II / ATP-dependent DNA helicase PcrA
VASTEKSKFDDFIKTQLNDIQSKAVVKKDGALLVVAGAGSGKTRVITSRMINLIVNEKVPPQEIIALTFTNKAAGEMKKRLLDFIGTHQRLPFVGTFHSYCLLLLRSNQRLLDFPNFSIMDSDDQFSLIKKIMKANGLEKFATASQICYQISNLKNSMCDGESSCEALVKNSQLQEIYSAYEVSKTAAHNMDFDDLILNVLKLFSKNPEFKESFQRKVRHVLIDEYQDTSLVQHQLLKCMALDSDKNFVLDSLCAVGDEDQSIYSWRGATVTNMLKFKKEFAPVKIIKIEQNYRSVQPILDAANNLIENNKLRNPKKLWSSKKAKNRILIASCRSGDQEAGTIATFLKSVSSNKKLSDIAILYRTHFQSRAIEEALLSYSIPYKIVGGIRFYERKEIKDLLAHMRLVLNPFDKISLLRVINCPARGLGPKFESQLIVEWQKNPFFDFKQILEKMCQDDDLALPPNKKKSVGEFLNVFKGITSDMQASDLVDKFIDRVGYLDYLNDNFDPRDADSKRENVQEFLRSIDAFEKNFNPSSRIIPPDDPFYVSSQKPTLENFIYEVTLMQEKVDAAAGVDGVQMMTLHAAKGLEFNSVIIAGLEEDLLPSYKSLNTPEELEEERRLFYVGITRAQEFLLLLKADYRNSFGQIVDHVESRFLDEVGDELYKSIDIEHMSMLELERFFNNWLGYDCDQEKVITFDSAFSRKIGATSYHVKARKESILPAQSLSCEWKKGQSVKHKKFGLGVITNIEAAQDNLFHITVIFGKTKKKILSNYLETA